MNRFFASTIYAASALLFLGVTLVRTSNGHAQYVLTSTNELGRGIVNGESQLIGTLETPTIAIGSEDGGPLYSISNTSTLLVGYLHQTPVGLLGNDILSLSVESGDSGTMIGVSYQDLYTINPSTAVATLVGQMGNFPESGYVSAQFDNYDTLYLVEQNGTATSSLYTVNINTGLASLVGPIGFEVTSLCPENGTLYGFTANGEVISVNRTTGAGTFLFNETGLSGVIIGASSNAIPEPSSLILAVLAVASLASNSYCGRRRIRTLKQARCD